MLVDGHNVGDYVGFRSGMLVAVSVSEYKPRGRTRWLCRCDCGNMKVLEIAELRRSIRPVRCCGCVSYTTHGKIDWPEYAAWRAMKYRCYTPTSPKYKDYGARGISVCDRWRSSFENFLADMGRRPSPKHSIDREDNDGNYEPGNCIWATAQQQNNNRRGALKQIGTRGPHLRQ